MKGRYIRVSTPNQKLERQLIKQHPEEQLFADIVSGSVPFSEREKGSELLSAARNNEITYLTVHSVDRLGRNILDILTTLEILEKAFCTVRVENLGIESLVNGKPNSAFKMIVSVLANVSEMERNSLLERQREGIAIAKAKGVYKGRIRGTVLSRDDFLNKYKAVQKDLKSGISIRKTAKIHNISAVTVQKVKRLMS